MTGVQHIHAAFEAWTSRTAYRVEQLPRSGSSRIYYRVYEDEQTFIAVWNPNVPENDAFVYLSRHFRAQGIKVPEILHLTADRGIYFQDDLGGKNLLAHRLEAEEQGTFPDELYQKALAGLVALQVTGATDLDFNRTYPRPRFDERVIRWDLNYFKYSFLNPMGIAYDQDGLEDAFEEIIDLILSQDSHYFLYRDFQSRNILIHENEPWFIDFQGGMQGPLLYDVAALLYQARAVIPEEKRTQLLEFYLVEAHKKTNIDLDQAKRIFPVFALLRVLQTIGAYGLRGLVEGKGHFLRSIQPAIDTSLKPLMASGKLLLKEQELLRVLKTLIESKALEPLQYLNKTAKQGRLTVRIQSFSYKRQVPKDPSGNGGGFVFDCRAIHNPGRYKPYKKLTGRDLPVQEFLLEQSEMPQFLEGVFHLVDASVTKYKSRNFEHLTVSFGCTGGQHRSVYSADRLAERLRKDPELDVIVTHIEQEIKQWEN